jgi:hypothetical protein
MDPYACARVQDLHAASAHDLTSLHLEDPSPGSPSPDISPSSPSNSSPDEPDTPPTPLQTAAIPIRSVGPSAMPSTANSISSSYGNSLITSSCPRDFSMGSSRPKRTLGAKTLHAQSPDMYLHNIAEAGLALVDYRDLSEHLTPFYSRMVAEVRLAKPLKSSAPGR